MNAITADGVGKSIGTITIKEAKDGVTHRAEAEGLAPGRARLPHARESRAATRPTRTARRPPARRRAGTSIRDATKAHKGPGGGGHKGDLPKLVVSDKGEAKDKLEVKGLTLADSGASAHDPRRRRQLQRHAQAARRRRRAHRLRRRQVASGPRCDGLAAHRGAAGLHQARAAEVPGRRVRVLRAGGGAGGGRRARRSTRRASPGAAGRDGAQLMTHYANDFFDLEADRANRTPTRWSGGSRVLPDGVLPPGVALGAALVLGARRARRRAGAGDARAAIGRCCCRSPSSMIALAWGYSAPPLRLCRARARRAGDGAGRHAVRPAARLLPAGAAR